MFHWKATAALTALATIVLTGCATGSTESPDAGSSRGERLTLIAVAPPISYDISAGAEFGNRSPFFQASFAIDADTALEMWPTNSYPSLFGFSPAD